MKSVGVAFALVLLTIVIDDAQYMIRAWSEFEADDAQHHIQFQVLSCIVVVWHLVLTGLSWRSTRRVHLRLIGAFVGLVSLVLLHSLLWPLAHHASEVEGASVGAKIFSGGFLFAAAILVWWSWRVFCAQPAVEGDAASPRALT